MSGIADEGNSGSRDDLHEKSISGDYAIISPEVEKVTKAAQDASVIYPGEEWAFLNLGLGYPGYHRHSTIFLSSQTVEYLIE